MSSDNSNNSQNKENALNFTPYVLGLSFYFPEKRDLNDGLQSKGRRSHKSVSKSKISFSQAYLHLSAIEPHNDFLQLCSFVGRLRRRT